MLRRLLLLILLIFMFVLGVLWGEGAFANPEVNEAPSTRLREDQIFLEPVIIDLKAQEIPQFKISQGPLPVFEDPERPLDPPYFLLEGTFSQKDSRLIIQKQPVGVNDKTGAFQLKVPLGSARSKLNVLVINPYGQVQKQLYHVLFPGWLAYQIRLNTPPFPRHSWTLELLGTQFLYRQTGLSPALSQTGLVIKPSWTYKLGSRPDGRWDAGLNGYWIFLPLRTNLTWKTKPLGINLRIGYQTPWLSPPWILKFIFGWYYLTMLTQDKAFGFQNVSGPMIFPTLIRLLSQQQSLFFYLKVAPISSGFSLQSSSYEGAAGGGYLFPINSSQQLSISLNFSTLRLNLGAGQNAQSQSISTGVGLSW